MKPKFYVHTSAGAPTLVYMNITKTYVTYPTQPTPTVPTVVSELTAPTLNDVAIASIIPTDPLFPPCL